jgi:creatinine amidohydrolase
MNRPWMLGEVTLADIRRTPPDVVVLPFGATEPHNLHLPYATDTIETELIASHACQIAHQQGAHVLCLPAIPYGTETNLQAFPLALNLMPSTLLAILKDLIGSLEASKVRKCVILNGHGGNELKGHLRELYGQTPIQLFLCNWYAICREQYGEVFEATDDHAGEMETSLILHARPELVQMQAADAGMVRRCRFEAVRNGWVQITRPWHLLTTNSGAGDPRGATAEKGKCWLDRVSRTLAQFLVELARSPLDDQFPFEAKQ